jgi:hypothetical protein
MSGSLLVKQDAIGTKRQRILYFRGEANYMKLVYAVILRNERQARTSPLDG